jgi:hypothetical protein
MLKAHKGTKRQVGLVERYGIWALVAFVVLALIYQFVFESGPKCHSDAECEALSNYYDSAPRDDHD